MMSQEVFIFSPEASGLPFDRAARRSGKKYARGEAELGVYEEFRSPTGHILTAWEAYTTFGPDVLEEAKEWGSAILRSSPNATRDALRKRRESLELSQESVARAARATVSEVKAAETTQHSVSIQNLERIAFALGLDERFLAFRPDAGGDSDLAYRLRKLQSPAWAPVGAPREISAGTALLFAEAASIIRVQRRLQAWLRIPAATGFQPNADYGDYQNPAWRSGYNLAYQTRKILGLGESPIYSMRELVEKRLGIPVIQARLPETIAGATVMTTDENGDAARGVVLNTVGANQNVSIRRATLAHELGHLLYDPDDRLDRVRVDSYQDSQIDAEDDAPDYVEQRANAFAIAFLAPNDAVRLDTLTPISEESVARVMDKFGISHTAARYHISNCHYRNFDVPETVANSMPSDEWMAAEDFALDYFPLMDATPYQRRGRFAGVVAASYEEGLITEDTAALYLGCEKQDIRKRASDLRSLYGV